MIGGAPDSPCRSEKPGPIPVPSVPEDIEASDTATLARIESKLDFILRQNSRKESVALVPEAFSALAQAGMDPRELSTHRVVTGLDDWEAEQVYKEIKGSSAICLECKGKLRWNGTVWKCDNPKCDVEFQNDAPPKEVGDEQR